MQATSHTIFATRCLPSQLPTFSSLPLFHWSTHSSFSLMVSQSAMRNLNGTNTELLHIGGEATKLFLLSANGFQTSPCFKSGNLSVHLITFSDRPMAMASCMVGDHCWMLAKDSLVLRVAQHAFVLALPGFLYGLTLSGDCGCDREKLEGIFERFTTYHDLLARGGLEPEEVGAETFLWTGAYSRIERLVHAAGKFVSRGAEDIEVTAKKFQRAVRTSALVKLVSRTLLSGILSPVSHVHLMVSPSGRSGTDGAYFLPSMWALADLLNAMETGYVLDQPLPPAAAPLVAQDGHWYFNREGMILLLKLVKAQVQNNGRLTKKPRLQVVAEEVPEMKDCSNIVAS